MRYIGQKAVQLLVVLFLVTFLTYLLLDLLPGLVVGRRRLAELRETPLEPLLRSLLGARALRQLDEIGLPEQSPDARVARRGRSTTASEPDVSSDAEVGEHPLVL